MAEPEPARANSTPAGADLTGTMVGRFAVRARLGAGGMGEVYRAEDTVLKRPVALKRMAPSLRANEQYRRRFLKEAERASALNHHRIASVYDVLQEQGDIFLVMEYVEGATLRQRLKEPIGLAEFLEIAAQCAEALAAAHEKGIVHRDIKPENIILSAATDQRRSAGPPPASALRRSSQVKILDFGVAKRLPGLDDNVVTESVGSVAGGLTGTPGYMAPEVLLEEEVDGRADIFSLGVVFYEALTGRHPFLGGSFVGMVDRVLHLTPPPISQINPRVPAELERVVNKMLAKDRNQRYATAADLLVDLRGLAPGGAVVSSGVLASGAGWQARLPARAGVEARAGAEARPYKFWLAPRRVLVAAAVLLVLMAGAFVALRPRWTRQNLIPLPEQKNLVVLPFQAAGGGAEDQVYCDGLTETVTSKLARVRSLEVPSSQEVRSRHIRSLEQARTELGANLVLAASWLRSGDRVRVDLDLVDTRTSKKLRSDSIAGKAADSLALEDRVLSSALGMLEVELPSKEARALAAHDTNEPSAYDYYLRGRGYLQEYQRPENIELAVAVFNQALNHDRRYALAYAGLGEAYRYKYEQTSDSKWIGEALGASQKAISLDEGLADGHTGLGRAYIETGKYEQAVRELKRAVELDPTSEAAYRNLAYAYEHLRQPAEAEKTYRRAIELRPHYWAGYNWLGMFYYNQARYAEAAQAFAQVVALAPDCFFGYSNMGGSYILQGRYAEAIQMCQRSVAIRPTGSAYNNLATAYFNLKRFPEALRNYEEAVKLEERNFTYWGNLGDASYWAPGQRAQAVGAYQKAIALAKEQLQVNPKDAGLLRKLARYHAMLQDRGDALAYLDRALTLAPGDPEVRFNAALVHHQFGETDQALSWLEKAVAAGYSLTTMRDHPIFDNLRSNPRFQKLLRGPRAGP